MKKTIYFCLYVLFFLGVSSLRSGAQVIASYSNIPICYTGYDSLSIMETGYVPTDVMIVSYGDGITDTVTPSGTSMGGTAYYYPFHMYAAPGTYTKKIVLLSGGVRVDSVTYTYVWNPCQVIHLIFYSDNNSNCALDFGDTHLFSSSASVRVDSAGVPVDTMTSNYSIYYYAHGPSGTVYTFTVITPPPGLLPTCPSTGIVSFTLSSALYYADSIGFECNPLACLDNGVYGGACAAVVGARANMYLATSSCTPITATATITFSTKYSLTHVFGSSSYTVSGNVITFTSTISATSPSWNYALFAPVGTLALGDTAQFTFATPTSGDCNTANNSLFIVDTLTASYDPNHKSVKPDGPIAAGTQLEYMLEFENTGNGVAENIHLLDTLSDNLDINTIKQTASSAPCNMILMTWAGHNIVKFDFPGINLADSSHHPECQGFVSFTINAKTTLTPGTNIDNRVGIYFDTNPVVMTNTVRSTIPVPSQVANVTGNVVEVYPNPVNDVLTIKTANSSYNTVTVTNMLGQTVLSSRFDNTQATVNVKALPAGIYYVTLRGESGVKVQKFEKL